MGNIDIQVSAKINQNEPNKSVFQACKLVISSLSDEIKTAIEKAFNVKVLGVKTLNIKGKKKRLGKNEGFQSSWKKAIVTLAEGQSIEYFDGA